MATQVSDTGGKSRARGSSSDELGVIAQRAQAFTNASGTAIALSEGSTAEMICRARSGSNSPEVGTAMRVEGSFTGLCIQSGKELRCDDAETDTRVDTAGMRAIGIRSMVVTPIKEENRVVGVLMVFAPTAHAFTITHVAVLKTMADQISSLLQRERRAREEGNQPEPVRPSAPVIMPKPVAAVPAPAPVLPPPVVIKPAASSTSAATARATFPVVSRVEPIKTSPVAEEVMAPTPFPKRKERREERRTEHKLEHRASLGTLDAVAGEEKKSSSRLIIIGVAGALAIAAVSSFAFLKMRKLPAQSVSVQQHVQEAPNPSTAAQPVAPELVVVAANNTQPSQATSGNPSATSSAPVASNASAKPSFASNSVDSAKEPADKTSMKNNAPTPAEKRAPETVALSTGTSKIVAADNAGQQSSDAAPVLTVGGAAAPGALTVLAKPVASSTPSMISQSNPEPVAMPAAGQQGQLRKVRLSTPPQYPELARKMNVQGVARVLLLVTPEGKVADVKELGGNPVLVAALAQAVKKWRYEPADRQSTIEVRFEFK